MTKINIPAGFEEPVSSLALEKAVAAGRNRREKLHAAAVQYHPALESLLISFADGCALALPVKNYPEFSVLNTRQLEQISVGFAGTALCLDSQDLHVSITGLISASPSLLEMATSVVAARNGSRRSNAKAHASRENGKKGGRPRKSV